MKNIKSFIAVAVLGVASTAATAQNLNSGYFNDGYLYRHDLNPAFGNDQKYIAFPALGNLNLGIRSNLGVNKILYNVDGRTALFLHPKVDTGEFLSGIHDKNKIGENLKLQVFGAGFSAFGGYNTVEINARQNLGVNLPGSLLRMAKEGLENKIYDISDFSAHADAYAELAFGHSHQIDDKLRVGAKAKILLGIGNIDANFNKASLTLGGNEWSGVTNAEIQTSLKSMAYKTEVTERGPEGDKTPHKYVNDIDIDSWGIAGFGLGFDLGAEYKLDQNWSFSAALLDLGFIGYSNNYVASTNGDQWVHTDKFLFSFDDDNDHSFEREGDRFLANLSELYELQDNGNTGGRTKALAATMNLGVQYTPDFYDKLTFGLMNSTRMGKYGWTEFRLSANVSPVKAFSASATLAAGTFGASFGWLLNAHPTGFNFFLGMDHTLGSLAKQGVPLSGKADLHMGINIPF